VVEALTKAIALAVTSMAPLQPDEVARRIERYYPKLQAARTQVDAARARLKERRGAFDPIFTIDTSHLRYNSSSNRGKAYATEMTEGVVEMTTPGGLKLFAGSRLNLGDVKSPNSSTGTLGEYFVRLKIPLLRGNGLNDRSVGEAQAQIGVSVAEQDVALFRLEALEGGVSAYWQWAAATRKREIAAQLLAIARTRADQIRIRVEREDLPRIELTEAETEVRRREGDLVRADRQRQAAANRLALYLWGPDGDPARLPESPAADFGTPATVGEKELAEAEASALARRPELAALELSQRAVQLTLDLARNDRKPALDFVVSPGFDAGGDAIGSTMKAGIFYSVPLRQNAVDGRIEEARTRLRKIQLDREFAARQVRVEVQDAANAVDAAYQRTQLAQAEVELAERLERGERIRYEAGEGTLFLLIQRERATAEARARLVDVLAEYQQARVTFRAATADL
jgi:outer membrane protein TolC